MADAPDLGSGAFGRGGSSPFSRTIAQINRMISKGPWGTEGLFCWTAV